MVAPYTGGVSTPGRRPGEWTKEFNKWLRARLKQPGGMVEPLPTTRDLAERYEVANSTVFRQFLRLEEEGVLWRAASGRFYNAQARSMVDKPLPVACLFRRIEDWSLLYQELMEGIGRASEQAGRASLLWHDDGLVRHGDVGHPPRFSSPATQEKSIKTFLDRYGSAVAGVILDHAWSDKALAAMPAEIKKKCVLLCRPGPAGIASVAPNALRAAELALTHLLATGCGSIHPVRPFSGDSAVDFMLKAIHEAAASAGIKTGLELAADTPAARTRLITELGKPGKPTGMVGLMVPEDNVAQLLREECIKRRIQTIKLISLQGTRRAAGITHIKNDYAAIGAQAVHLLINAGQGTGDVPAPRLVVE